MQGVQAMQKIHSTAIIDGSADLGDEVEVGAYAIVEGRTKVGRGTLVEPHAHILENSIIGEHCSIGRSAIIGGDPQDTEAELPVESGVQIGSACTIREHVTVHRSTSKIKTTIGSGNYLMAGTHVAHDVVIGKDNVFANNTLLGGHVVIGDHVITGGGAAFHQHVRVGSLAMIQGNSSFSLDVPPYVIGSQLNGLVGLNVIGLQRSGIHKDIRAELSRLYKLICRRAKPFTKALAEARELATSNEGVSFVSFFESDSKRGGVCVHRRRS